MSGKSLPSIEARPNTIISHSQNRPMQNLTIVSFGLETTNSAIQKAVEYETRRVLRSSAIWLPASAAGIMSTGSK